MCVCVELRAETKIEIIEWMIVDDFVARRVRNQKEKKKLDVERKQNNNK